MFDLMCPSDHVTIIMPGFKTKYKKIYIFLLLFFFCSLSTHVMFLMG